MWDSSQQTILSHLEEALRKSRTKFSFKAGARDECCYPRRIRIESGDVESSPQEQPDVDSNSWGEFSKAHQALQQKGYVVLRNVLNDESIESIKRHLNGALKYGNLRGRKDLRESSGNGKNGSYAYYKPRPNGVLVALPHLVNWMYGDAEEVKGSRMVFLAYGQGGVNYLHQDQSVLPFQAMVLLSKPGTDFGGGEFMVTSEASRWRLHRCSMLPGDVVVFDASGFHGVDEILCPAEGGEAQRFAVGLFHQLDHEKSRLARNKKRRKCVS